MKYETLNLENQGGVWTLTIRRPEALNALNTKVLEEISEVLTQLAEKNFQEAKVLIITGEGEKAFVAGADIKEISQLSLDSAQKFAERGQGIFRKIENLEIPVIAAVNGFALGGGLELALACDFIFASEKARFGLPEVTLGLIPGFGGTVRLARAIGLAKAKEWIFTGQMVVAAEAQRMGLVNKVFSPTELLSSTKEIAMTMASRGPIAISAAKKSIMTAYDHDIDSAMAIEAAEFAQLFSSQDMREGTAAFIEKRKAKFQGL